MSLVARARGWEPSRDLSANPFRGGGTEAVWMVRAVEAARSILATGESKLRLDLTRDAGANWEPLFLEPPAGGPETWSIMGRWARGAESGSGCSKHMAPLRDGPTLPGPFSSSCL